MDKKLSRAFFISILVLTTVLFFWMVRAFAVPVLLAAVFATLFYPLYEAFLRVFRGRRNLAAFFSCFLLLLGLVVPLYGVADMVAREAIDFYNTAGDRVTEIVRQGEAGPLGRLRNLPFVKQLRLEEVDWASALRGAVTSAGSFAATVINKTSRGTIQVVIVLFTTLFTMFYFFRDGRTMLRRIRTLIPLDREYKNAIAARFSSVAKATVKGTLLIALVQGTLAGITLWIFGVGSPILWGVVAMFLSIIPLVGAWLVLYPAAFIQIATGNLWQGIGILVVTIVVIVNVDNLMRPRLVGQETGMHDLMVFFSTLGGIGMFGPMGFIIGPMIAALFLSVLDIYSEEFKDDLDVTRTFEVRTPEPAPVTAAPAAAPETPGGPALPELLPPEVRKEPVVSPETPAKKAQEG